MNRFKTPRRAGSDCLPEPLVWCVIGLTVLPFLLSWAGVDFRSDPAGAAISHTLLEWTSVCLAFLTAVIAFFHFGRTHDTLTPVIGAVLFWSACGDAFHTLASDNVIHRIASAERILPLTGTVSRGFGLFALLGGAAIVLRWRSRRGRWDKAAIIGLVGLFAAGTYLLMEYCVHSNHLPPSIFPTALVHRPWELAMGVIYLAVGYPLFRRVNQLVPNRFAHALLVSMVPQVASELAIAFGSAELYDTSFNLAHYLKILANAVPLSGLLLDYAQTYSAQVELVAALEHAAQVVEEERKVLERISGGASIQEVMDALASGFERMLPDRLCTILMLEEDGRHLRAVSGPRMQPEYMRAMDGMEIGPDAGSSGAAVFRNETVVVEDIATDRRFDGVAEFVTGFGLRSCYSAPIRDSKNQALGVLAMYHREPGMPRPQDGRLLEAWARLAGTAAERLRVEERLRADALRMSLAEKAAGFGVWECDLPKGRITVSEGMAAVLGMAPGEPLQIPASELVDGRSHPDDRARIRRAFEEPLARGGHLEAESRIVRPDGSIRYVRSHSQTEMKEGLPVRITGALIDITKEHEILERLVQARSEAETAARVKSEFLANMSHEIRTPINGIIGSISLLFDSELSADQTEHLQTIQSCGTSLLHLVDDILDVAKIESGKLILERTPFRLAELLAESLAIVGPPAALRGLQLRRRSDEALPETVMGDPQRLQQVLLNLLSNAIKFTEHGEVVLDVSLAECMGNCAGVRFEVRDTGIGIPEGAREAIFEPFVQGDSSTTRRYGGTGLGLPICARLVSLMGGKLELDSQVGAGSTFRFTICFPRVEPPPARTDRMPGAIPKSGRRLRVLLAEDNVINQKVAAQVLKKMGHEVDFASDGLEAVEAVRAKRYDLILMDCQMPRMDGYAATRAIRQLPQEPPVPIAAMTANATTDGQRLCQAAGMDYFLTKPVTTERLFALMEQISGEPAGRERAPAGGD